jgi:hypothetical protein
MNYQKLDGESDYFIQCFVYNCLFKQRTTLDKEFIGYSLKESKQSCGERNLPWILASMKKYIWQMTI